MQEQLEIRQEMSLVRSRGLANADMLARQVEKFSDWREHVRAHPWPIALGAAALGYWLIPTRARVMPAQAPAKHATQASPQSESVTAHDTESKASAGMTGAAMAFVGSLIGNAVRSYVSDQIHSLISTRGNHAASQQREAPFTRF